MVSKNGFHGSLQESSLFQVSEEIVEVRRKPVDALKDCINSAHNGEVLIPYAVVQFGQGLAKNGEKI